MSQVQILEIEPPIAGTQKIVKDVVGDRRFPLPTDDRVCHKVSPTDFSGLGCNNTGKDQLPSYNKDYTTHHGQNDKNGYLHNCHSKISTFVSSLSGSRASCLEELLEKGFGFD